MYEISEQSKLFDVRNLFESNTFVVDAQMIAFSRKKLQQRNYLRDSFLFWVTHQKNVLKNFFEETFSVLSQVQQQWGKPTHLTSVNIRKRTSVFIASWYYANS